MMIVQKITGKGLPALYEVSDLLGSEKKAHSIYRRAINHTGNKGFTQVKRTLAKQVGIKQSEVVARGALKKHPANFSTLEYVITSKGRYLPLRLFNAKQFSYGVAASPWGKRRSFKSAFIVDSIGGNVFLNTGGYNKKSKRNNAIEKMWGPSIPNEMVKHETADAFGDVGTALPKRVAHELKRASRGRLS